MSLFRPAHFSPRSHFSAERRTLTRKTESRTFSRACFPVAKRCWRSGTCSKSAAAHGRWRGGGFVEPCENEIFRGLLTPCLPQAGA
jgi:hypothetical protein